MRVRILMMAGLVLLGSAPARTVEPDPESLRKAGHWKQIRTLIEPGFRGNPGEVRNLYWMTRVKVAFGDLQAGYDMARRLVAASPEQADNQFALAEAVGTLARRVGLLKALSYQGEFKRSLERALTLNPRHAEALNMKALFYINAPFIVGGSKRRGMEVIRILATVDPALACLAEVNRALGEKDRARAEVLLKTAAANDPRSYLIQSRLAAFYLSAEPRQIDEAVRCASCAVAIDPGRVSAYNSLARAYASAGRWPQLDSTLLQAEQNVPDNLMPYFSAARTLEAGGSQLERAERYFRKYLTIEPEADAPDLASARWRLGQVLEKLGRKPAAIAEIEAALRLRPDLDGAAKDLKRLK